MMSSNNKQRFTDLLSAINKERTAEELYFAKLSAHKSLAERVESGILWYPVVTTAVNYTVGEQIEMTFERTKQLDLPHKLKSGTGCRLFKLESGKELSSFRGVISFVRKNKLSVILSEEVASKNELRDFKGQLGIEMIYDDRPFKVMESAIKSVQASDYPQLVHLRNLIQNPPANYKPFEIQEVFKPKHLNPSQTSALNGVVSTADIAIIHGPPGTGKTTSLIEVAKALLKSEKRILVCAPSNNAVDLLAIQLDKAGVSTLRIGNVTRIRDETSHLSLAEKARHHADWQHIKKIKIEASEARKLAAKRKRSFGPKERAERNAMYRESRELTKWAKDMEAKLLQTLISESQVICSTLIGIGHKSVADLHFSTLIIDEASQALEPECWNAMLRADRVILAGDHLQLAPTVKSEEAMKLGLANTLLNQLTSQLPHSYLLKTQYRMNEKILSFSNSRFYENALLSSPLVATWTLDETPLTLIDTSGCGFFEKQDPKTLSRSNEGEGFILREHFLECKDNYNEASIGIISPYSQQVKLLQELIETDDTFRELDITVNSIDGFQGQERDVIYISLVRSNDKGEIGFLADERRLNVAMTRAKKKLVIIGDMSTLSQKKLFTDLAEHIEKEGKYRSAWEFMQT